MQLGLPTSLIAFLVQVEEALAAGQLNDDAASVGLLLTSVLEMWARFLAPPPPPVQSTEGRLVQRAEAVVVMCWECAAAVLHRRCHCYACTETAAAVAAMFKSCEYLLALVCGVCEILTLI